MRNWINLINEYADPEQRGHGGHYEQGQAHVAKSLWERPGFKEWFHGSHVKTPNGEPLIAFHGTFEQFTEFSMDNGATVSNGFDRLGFWFDIDPRTPEYFAGYNYGGNTELKDEDYGVVMPCVLSIKNPFFFDSEFVLSSDAEELRNLSVLLKKKSDLYHSATQKGSSYILPDGSYFNPNEYYDMRSDYDNLRNKIVSIGNKNREDAWQRLIKSLPNGIKSTNAEVDAFKQELIENGHDGIYMGDTAADFATRDYAGTDWWVAFYPHQIKSVFAPSFSASSNNIMEQRLDSRPRK